MNKQKRIHTPLNPDDVFSKIMNCIITHPFDNITKRSSYQIPGWDGLPKEVEPKKTLDEIIKEKMKQEEMRCFKPNPPKSKFPLVDIIENITTIEYILYTPGYVKENIKVSIHDNYLTVTGNLLNIRGGYIQQEFFGYSFEEKFLLPKDVDLSKNIVAKCENGLTIIRIPKLVKEIKEPIVINVE
jgi:HSP20 family protein